MSEAIVCKVNLFLSGTTDTEHNGGWCTVLHSFYRENHIEKSIGGYAKHTTPTRMALIALLNGLKALHISEERITFVHIYTSVPQVSASLHRNMHQWQKNDWLTKAGQTPQHIDLYMQIYEILINPSITYKVHFINQKTHHSEHRLKAIQLSADYLMKAKRDLYEVYA